MMLQSRKELYPTPVKADHPLYELTGKTGGQNRDLLWQ